MSDRPTAALVYDFDGTLSPGSMQEHTLLPAIGYGDSGKFWKKVKSTNKDENGDEILAYMNHLLSVCGDVLSREMFVEHGGQIPLFAGVEDWFDRINEFGSARGLKIEHYVVSSGLEEMIEGCKIRRHFKHVFASKYSYKKMEGRAGHRQPLIIPPRRSIYLE